MSSDRVVVLGSGFAGLETAFLLRRLAGEKRIELTVVSDQDDFLYTPDAIYLPFGGAERSLHVSLAGPMVRRRIKQRIATVEGIDPARGVVHIADGWPIHYERLVIATGADPNPDEIPGLAEQTCQIRTPGQLHRLGERLRDVARRAAQGLRQQVLFLVPPATTSAVPLYEIVLMLDTWLRRRDLRHRVDLVFTTHEDFYLQAFGSRLHDLVTVEFAARDISGHTGAAVTKVAEGRATYADGAERESDLLVASPALVAAVRYDGLPADDRGFLVCEARSRAVTGNPEIFAPGDAGDFPVKQPFLAIRQGDAVADAIAADLTRSTPEDGFTPTSMFAMEMFDRAAYARVPLSVTGDPHRPVTLDESAVDSYRVGTSVYWRLGRKAAGAYLPSRFRRGLPVTAGATRRIRWPGARRTVR